MTSDKQTVLYDKSFSVNEWYNLKEDLKLDPKIRDPWHTAMVRMSNKYGVNMRDIEEAVEAVYGSC